MSTPRYQTLPEDLDVELSSRVMQPIYLVCIHFPGQEFYVSSQREETVDGNIYIANAVEADSIEQLEHTTSSTVIRLTNENNIASALVLNLGIQGVPITIRKAYIEADGSLTTPYIMFKGEGGGARLFPMYVEIAIKKRKANTQYAPNIAFSASNGFNHLVQAGQVLVINGEKYELGGD